MSLKEARAALRAGDLGAARRAFQAVLAATAGAPSGEPDRVEALDGLLHVHDLEHGDQEPIGFLRARLRILDDADPMPNLVKAETIRALAEALGPTGEARELIDGVIEYLGMVLGDDDEATQRARATRDALTR